MANVKPPVPESFTVGRADWPRLVARRVNEHEREIAALANLQGATSRAKLRFLYG